MLQKSLTTTSGNILDPLSLNLYTYGHNNPISYYDPTGHSIKSIIKSIGNTVKKAVNTVKTVVTAAKPVVKQSVKTAAAVTVNITVRKAIEPVASTLKSVQAKTENKRQVYQEKVNNYALKGTVEKAIAGFDQGLIDGIDSAVNGVYPLYNHPLETISDVFGSTLENFSYESRINRNKAFGQNYADANKSGYTGISAVTYNMGREFPEFALTVAAGMKGSPQAGKGTKPPTGGNSIRNAFNSPFNGSPQLAGANGIVISGAVPAEVSISSNVSAGALGVRAGVAGSVAVSNIYYNGKGSGQSSGGFLGKENSNSLLTKTEETTRVRHYTNRKGINGIENDGKIIAKDNNRVYVEPANKKALSQIEAETKYQIKPGKGRDYIEFDVPNSKLEWVKNPRYGVEELTIKGGIEELVNPSFIRRK